MHRSEISRASSTARLAGLTLKNYENRLVGAPGTLLDLSDLQDQSRQALMLFPEASAPVLTEDFVSKISKPITLVVPDGSWAQAKRIGHKVIKSTHIPCVRLNLSELSRYPLRRNQRQGSVCTLEAIAFALGILERPAPRGTEVTNQLLYAVELLVKSALKSRGVLDPLMEGGGIWIREG